MKQSVSLSHSRPVCFTTIPRLSVCLLYAVVVGSVVPQPALAKQNLEEAVTSGVPVACDQSGTGQALLQYCADPGGAGSASANASIINQTDNFGQQHSQAIEKRLEQQRAGCSKEDIEQRKPGCAPAGGASGDEITLGKLGVFVSGQYEHFIKDVTNFEPGWTSNREGITAGADYRLSERTVVGAALTYDRTDGDYKHQGGSFDINSFGALLYASIIPTEASFVDVAVGYARNGYDTKRNINSVTTGNARGDTDGDRYSVSTHAGYDFTRGAFTFGPRAGISYVLNHVGSFEENGNTGLELSYDDQSQSSLTSHLGVQGSRAFSTSFGVLVPQLTVDYIHEFLADQGNIDSAFAQSPGVPVVFAGDKPDRNYMTLGVGVSAVLPNGISPFLDSQTLIGYEDRQSYTVTLGVRFEL